MRPGAVHGLSPIFAASLMLLNGCGGANKIVLQEFSEKIYAVESNTSISVHNRDGAVLIYGSNLNELRVRSTKKAYSRERLNQIAIDVSTQPGAISVTAKFPPHPRWRFPDHSGTVDCTIVVPATATISALDLNAGEVLLDSMHGREVPRTVGRRPDFRPELLHEPGSYNETRHADACVRLVGTRTILRRGKRRARKRLGIFANRSRLSPRGPRSRTEK